MRWIAALIAVVACGAVAASVAIGSMGTASLRVVDRDPLTIQGHGFKARERVRVTASVAESPHVRLPASPQQVIRTSAKGSFRIAFSEIFVDRCNWVRVVVIRGGGYPVVLKLLPSPLCAPLLSPH